jgi:glycerol uptake facilitator-like aquaporin
MTARALVAESLGTAMLLLAVVGSGIVVGGHPEPSDALFQHAVVVGVVLVAAVLTFAHVSGAHLNPAVTLADVLLGGTPVRTGVGYAGAQLLGAGAGTVLAHAMFGLPLVTLATTDRSGAPGVLSEVVATFVLLLVIHGIVRSGAGTGAVAAGVGAWITGAIVATSSDAFANPAVTLARTLTDTWTGMAPGGVAGFLAGQLLAAVAAAGVVRWLFATPAESEAGVTATVPVEESTT